MDTPYIFVGEELLVTVSSALVVFVFVEIDHHRLVRLDGARLLYAEQRLVGVDGAWLFGLAA